MQSFFFGLRIHVSKQIFFVLSLFLSQISFKMKQVIMNKMILILMFLYCSCKNSNTADYDNSILIDSSSIVVDTISSNNKNSMDDTVDNQLKRMLENRLSYEEVMQSNSVEDYENFIEHNPQHEKIENVKAKLIDLKFN